VESGNWVEDFYDEIGDDLEGTDWHEEHYYDADYGGYHKTSKVQKEIVCPNVTLHLAEDFHHSKRDFFQLNKWSIPESLLWIDKLKKWW
jgi:hypothetical protein